MADTLKIRWGAMVDILFQDARMVVQIFLVSAGYLVARSLSTKEITAPLSMILRRYVRLLPASVAALALTLLATEVMRHTIDSAALQSGYESWLPSEPSWLKLVSHLLFLQDILQIDALTVGVWYIAIDLQLFITTVLIMWALNRVGGKNFSFAHYALFGGLCVSSFWFFNLTPDLDNYAVYFFGAYGLGLLAFWASKQRLALVVFVFTIAMALGSFVFEPRARVLIAVVTSLCLYFSTRLGAAKGFVSKAKYIHLLSDSSYALFLNHFAVIIMLSGVWLHFKLQSEVSAWIFITVGWIFSFIYSLLLHQYVEKPGVRFVLNQLDRTLRRRRPAN